MLGSLGILRGLLKTCTVALWTNRQISAAVDPLKQGPLYSVHKLQGPSVPFLYLLHWAPDAMNHIRGVNFGVDGCHPASGCFIRQGLIVSQCIEVKLES